MFSLALKMMWASPNDVVSANADTNEKSTSFCRNLSIFGLPDRIRTYGLQSRSLTRYPAVPRVDIFYFNINNIFCQLFFAFKIQLFNLLKFKPRLISRHGLSLKHSCISLFSFLNIFNNIFNSAEHKRKEKAEQEKNEGDKCRYIQSRRRTLCQDKV